MILCKIYYSFFLTQAIEFTKTLGKAARNLFGQILLTEPSSSCSSETPLFPSLTARKSVSWKAVALELLRKVFPNYDCSGFANAESSPTAAAASSQALETLSRSS